MPSRRVAATRRRLLQSATFARLGFLSGGPADSFGMLLDNVVMTAGGGPVVTPAVPENSTWMLLTGGLALVGSLARRRRPA